MTDFQKSCREKVLRVLNDSHQKISRMDIELRAGISRAATINALRILRQEKLVKRRTRSRNSQGIIGKEVLYWLA